VILRYPQIIFELIIMQPSRELSYWLGVVQADGYLDEYFNKKRKLKFFRISLCVSGKSLPMLKRFQEISLSELNRKTKIFVCKNKVFKSTIGVKELLEKFKELEINFGDPPEPPFWVAKTPDFFGAYLAGLIDRDGNVTVRNKIKKCEIRIASSKPQSKLKEILEIFLKCKVRILDKTKTCGCYYLDLIVSSKNYKFFKEFVLPYLAIQYKKDKLQSFIDYLESKFGDDS
jgi:hypothetical protein